MDERNGTVIVNAARRVIDKTIDFIYLSTIVNSPQWALDLIRTGVTRSDFRRGNVKDSINIPSLNLTIDKNKQGFLLDAFTYASNLKDHCKATFRIDEHSQLVADIGDIRALLSNFGDLMTLDDVFLKNEYEITLTGPSVILDVGMNVGFASLFFARNRDAVVFGYEPFSTTYQQALKNFDMNTELRGRIRPNQYGLAGSTRNMNVQYSFELNRSAGIFGVSKDCTPKGPRTHDEITEDIQLKDATEEIRRIRKEFPSHDMILKLDCEGAEYEIIDSLSRSGELRRIKALLVEWHIRRPDNDPEDIVRKCEASGFIVGLRKTRAPTGSLFAIKAHSG